MAEGSPDTPHSSWSSSHSSSSTFSSPSGSSASTSSKSGGKSKDGETGTASSGFSLVHDLDPNDGEHVLVPTEKEGGDVVVEHR